MAPALPWSDALAFAEQMLGWELRSYGLAQSMPGIVFFDRGLPDILGYLRLHDLPAPPHLERAAARVRYNPRVIIAPPWEAIFHQDSERRQDFAEAVRTHDAMVATYEAQGYRLVTLPCVPVAERVRFILANF